MKRAWRAGVAGVATLPMAMTLASAAAAAQPDIDALVSEIEQLPREAFDADPRRWQEVFDLLEELLAARQPTIGRGGASPADAAAAQDFVQAFRRSSAKLREVTPDDLASRLLSASLNGAGAAVINGSGTATAVPAAALAQLAELMAAGPAGANPDGGLWPLLTLTSQASTQLLLRKAELANAGKPNAAALNDGVHDAITRLQTRAGRSCQDLQRLQRQAGAMSQRVAVLDALVQRNAGLATRDPAALSAGLGRLRAELSALQVQQREQLLDLGARELVAGSAPAPGTPMHAGRSALADDLARRVDTLHDTEGDAAAKAMRIAQQELNLAALDALAREELIKAALLRQGRQAQGELMQASAEASRLIGSIDRVAVK